MAWLEREGSGRAAALTRVRVPVASPEHSRESRDFTGATALFCVSGGQKFPHTPVTPPNNTTMARRVAALEADAQNWIEEVTGERFFSDYVTSLKDGVLLCKCVPAVGREGEGEGGKALPRASFWASGAALCRVLTSPQRRTPVASIYSVACLEGFMVPLDGAEAEVFVARVRLWGSDPTLLRLCRPLPLAPGS
jgi:hypothetical protein